MMDLLRASIEAEIPHLRRYARVLVGHPDDADDLVQAALERALIRADQWNPRRHLRPWLFRIQHNLYVSWVRRRDRERAFGKLCFQSTAVDSGHDAELELGVVQRAMEGLPSEQRDVIWLVAVQGLTYEEVSKALVVPVGTVRSRLSRGREALRAMLNGRRAGGPVHACADRRDQR
ncbi:MAG: RNA polymerase sigma factor [Aquisalimonadaceae bacterium]